MTSPEFPDFGSDIIPPSKEVYSPKKMQECIDKCDEITLGIVRLKKGLEYQVRGIEILKKEYEHENRLLIEAETRLVLRLFDLIDELDKSEEFTVDFGNYINIRIRDILGREGIHSFTVQQGDPFDPEKHNAVMLTSDPSLTEDTVTEVLRCGYMKNDKILRKADVIKNFLDGEKR